MDNVNEAPKQPALDALLSLDLRSVKAINPADLSFIIVNETITLVPYRQAAFYSIGYWRACANHRIRFGERGRRFALRYMA